MKTYHSSYYNFYLSENDKFLVFNSITGSISNITEKLFYSIKDNSINTRDPGFNFLLKCGYITTCNSLEEERSKAIQYYSDAINKRILQLTIIVTGQCNLRCVYCYEHFDKGKMDLETQEEIILYLENALPNYESLYVTWFGGEPLTALDIIESLSAKIQGLCTTLGKNYTASITTNGVFLTPKVHSILDRCNVKSYQITLDGDKKTHDKQRITPTGKGSYDRIYNNLLAMKSSTFQHHITIRINIAHNNVFNKDFQHFFNCLYSDFGQDRRFNLHLAAVSDLEGTEGGSIDICDTGYLFPYYIFAQNAGFGFSHYKILFKPLHLVCYAANPNAFVIDSNGTIRKCTVALYDVQNNLGYLKDGKMVLNREKEILWNQNKSHENPVCASCELLPTCFGKFCPLENIQKKIVACPPMEKNLAMYMKLFLGEGTENINYTRIK